jgi:hypothetical protein
VAAVRDSEKRIVDKFTEITSAVHDRTFLEINAGFASIGKTFETSLTATATSIRKGNEELVLKVENERLQRENAELSRDHDIGDGRVRK